MGSAYTKRKAEGTQTDQNLEKEEQTQRGLVVLDVFIGGYLPGTA